MANTNRRSTRSSTRGTRTSSSSTRSGNSRSTTTRSTGNSYRNYGGSSQGSNGSSGYGNGYGSSGSKYSSKKTGGGASAAIVVLVVLIVAIAAVGLLTWSNVSYLYDEDIIIPGVAIEGVDIGGLTKDEAFVLLNNQLSQKTGELSVTLRFYDQQFTYDSASIPTSGDVWPIINEAILYGHRGNLRQRMDEAKYVLENDEVFSISFGYDQNSIRQIIQTLKADLDIPAVEPSLEFDKDAGKITGIEDRTALLYNPLKYDTQITVNGAPGEIYIDANGDYRINAEIFKVIPGATGQEIDVEATLSNVIADLSDDSVAIVDMVAYVVEPKLTEADIAASTSLVYHSKSGLDYRSTTSRDKNIEKALLAFDGMVINPGDIVSFDEVVGERIKENGFLLAPGISQDKSLKEVYGGGVCQASTIIFNAALMAGCKIIDKDSHSWPLYYAEDDFGTEARDSMVNWGTSDLVFQNTTQYPIYFDTYVHWKYSDNATHAYCNVYTKLLPDGQSIKYNPILVNSTPTPEPEVNALTDTTQFADKTWKEDSETGLLVYKYSLSRPYKYYEVMQQIVDASGNVISETLWYKSEYDEHTGVYYTKPNPNATAEP